MTTYTQFWNAAVEAFGGWRAVERALKATSDRVHNDDQCWYSMRSVRVACDELGLPFGAVLNWLETRPNYLESELMFFNTQDPSLNPDIEADWERWLRAESGEPHEA